MVLDFVVQDDFGAGVASLGGGSSGARRVGRSLSSLWWGVVVFS